MIPWTDTERSWGMHTVDLIFTLILITIVIYGIIDGWFIRHTVHYIEVCNGQLVNNYTNFNFTGVGP